MGKSAEEFIRRGIVAVSGPSHAKARIEFITFNSPLLAQGRLLNRDLITEVTLINCGQNDGPSEQRGHRRCLYYRNLSNEVFSHIIWHALVRVLYAGATGLLFRPNCNVSFSLQFTNRAFVSQTRSIVTPGVAQAADKLSFRLQLAYRHPLFSVLLSQIREFFFPPGRSSEAAL